MELVETERLRLERWEARHTDALARINAEPAVMRFVDGGAPAPREATEQQSARFAGHWERFGFGLWAVVERESSAMIGFAGVCHPLWFPAEADRVEVGWRLHPDAWGRGYATEAARAGLGAAFEWLGLDDVVAYIHPDNARSRAVAERVGMRHVRDASHPRSGRPIVVYAIARAEYDAVGGSRGVTT